MYSYVDWSIFTNLIMMTLNHRSKNAITSMCMDSFKLPVLPAYKVQYCSAVFIVL